MSEIVISGYYGFKNAGDEAMLAAMIEVLTDIDPHVRLTVISGDAADTRRRHGVAAIHKMNYPEIARALKRCDLLISGGGSLLQDVTSERSLYYYLSIMLLAKMLGKPVMLYAQGIGPVSRRLARLAMRCVGNRIDFITVRDEQSLEALKRLKVTRPPMYVTADPVLAIHPVDKQIGRKILRRHGLEGAKPLVGISVREWRDWTHYKDVLAAATDRIVEELDARVVYIPMQFPEDVAAAEKIAARCKNEAALLKEEYTTSELLSLVGNLDLLISVRLHALIFAGVMNAPMIGISYDPKVEGFLHSIGETNIATLETVTLNGLMREAVQKLRPCAAAAAKKEDLIGRLRSKAFHNADLALEIVGAYRRAR